METSNCEGCICLMIRANGQETTKARFYTKYAEIREKPPKEFRCGHFSPSRYISSGLPPWRSPDWCPNRIRGNIVEDRA